ncbi:MAG: lysine biosynthesis protein LysW [Candidatus Dormibacteria bacterium]
MSADLARSEECPDCGAQLDLAEAEEVGDLVDCPNCGAAFEVVALTPFTLVAFVDEEK